MCDQSKSQLLGPSGQSEAQLLGPLRDVTGFHTKPPIMPYFSGFHSVLFIIQRRRRRIALLHQPLASFVEPNAPSQAALPRLPPPPLCRSLAAFAPPPSPASGPALSRRNPPPFPFHSTKLSANQRRGNVRPPARSGAPPACPAPFLRMQRKERQWKREKRE